MLNQENVKVFAKAFNITLGFFFLLVIALTLIAINTKLWDIREIVSETRDANWIIACDDISPVESPSTFIHCNQ